MKKFDIPSFYRSPIISAIKEQRRASDKLKKDFTPTTVDFGPVQFHIARHFGFCYGVENAIEIIYRVIQENPKKRIFLLSEMIHNPNVNQDLLDQGVQFIHDTQGNEIIAWETLTNKDIIVIPAFGTTVKIFEKINEIGLETHHFDTTCPFVEKVWKRANKLGKDDYTVIIHGKRKHEETRATFSHAIQGAPALIVQNLDEVHFVRDYILGQVSTADFNQFFEGYMSEGFHPEKDLKKIGVINQTTMLATETQEIADLLKQAMTDHHGQDNIEKHFADTRDTLCYATSDNQKAVYGLLEKEADFALVIGGYNSSNTSHLVELCEETLPTYFINGKHCIKPTKAIEHFDYRKKEIAQTKHFIPKKEKLNVLITSGASCPDAIVEEVIAEFANLFDHTISTDDILATLK